MKRSIFLVLFILGMLFSRTTLAQETPSDSLKSVIDSLEAIIKSKVAPADTMEIEKVLEPDPEPVVEPADDLALPQKSMPADDEKALEKPSMTMPKPDDGAPPHDQPVEATPDTTTEKVVKPAMIQEPQEFLPNKLFLFAQDAYGRKDKEIMDFLIDEFTDYIALFPEGERVAEAQYRIGKLYQDLDKEHQAFAAYVKGLFVYGGSSWENECAKGARKLLNDIGDFKARRSEILAMIDHRTNGETDAERYFQYLDFMHKLADIDLDKWIISDMRYFITHFPDDLRIDTVLVWIGDVYQAKPNYNDAEVAYLKLEYMYPASDLLPDAKFQRAEILYHHLEKYEIATDVYGSIVREYPEHDYAPLALFNMAEIKTEKMKEHRGAINDYRQCVDTYPDFKDNEEAVYRMGWIAEERLKDYLGALDFYNEFVTNYPNQKRGVEVLERMSGIYKDKLNSYQNASDQLVRIADLYPDYEDAPQKLIEAGDIIANKMDDYNLAIEYYDLVLTKYPDHKKAKDARKRIEKMEEKLRKKD